MRFSRISVSNHFERFEMILSAILWLVSTNCQQIPILGRLCSQYNQSKNPLKPLPERICYGGPGEDRTPDLRVAKANFDFL